MSLTITSTYNHYFTDTIQKIRQRKHQKLIKDAEKASEVSVETFNPNRTTTMKPYVDPAKLQEAMTNSIERDMDTFSSAEALDTQRAYYKVEPLPEIILSPVTVTQMSEAEIEFVAAEPPETTQQREHLEHRRVMLEKGLETFREAMGGLKR
jgi:hypothetical protein